ncbi:MAG: SUMF1/EgtB/PvdO family nonheme iron enzyme [Caldimonas sp.]
MDPVVDPVVAPLQRPRPDGQRAEGAARPDALRPTGHGIFLSYNRENVREASLLRDGLRDEGLDVFMDSVHLVAGEPWHARLRSELADARAVIVLMRSEGPRGFVLDEVSWALDQRERAEAAGLPPPGLFPVCLGEVPERGTLDERVRALLDYQVTRWPPGQVMPVGLLARLRAALPPAQFAPQKCPFRGLANFDETDSDWFFGRLRESHEVIDTMGSAPNPDGSLDRQSPGHRRLVLVSGDSGSGKSSLLRAGVLPRLRAGALWPRTGLSHWRVSAPMRPGVRPLHELALALAGVPGSSQAGPAPLLRASVESLLERLRGDRHALAALLAEQVEPDTGVLLVLDQCEELVLNGVNDEDRRQFDALLASALTAADCPLYLVGTVRADALAEFDALLPDLAQARNRWGAVYALPRITDAGLRLAIEEPARRADVDVSEVAELILAEARSEPGALALVQHAMWSLWHTAHRRGPVVRLQRSDHEAAGGLAGMLSRDADAALLAVKAELGSDGGALRLLLRMTWVGAEDRLFRRRLDRATAELEAGGGDRARGERVIELLASTEALLPQGSAIAAPHLPLLITGSGDDAGGGAYVELVHEMLLRTRDRPGMPAVPHWQRLHEFIEAHLDELKLSQRLQTDVLLWRRLGPWQRWRRLASFKEQRLYARISNAADPDARRYLALSRTKSTTLAAAVALPLAYLGVGSWFVFRQPDTFPINYALRLPLWAVGLGPVPEFVSLPGATARFDLGCDPARDTVGDMGCGAGFLPLQRDATHAITCDMGRHEVSFEQYDRYVFTARRTQGATVAYPAPGEKIRGALPVMEVSRAEAEGYARWLTAQGGGRPRYRLPREWEWEYAARAGSAGPYPWGSEPPEGRAQYNNRREPPAARPVHEGEPNAFGLFNVVGNASEWVADDADPADAAAPRYVWRGGSFNQGRALVRIAARQSLETDLSGEMGTATNIGFRLCRERTP